MYICGNLNYIYVCRGYMGIMAENMEATIV